MDGTGGLTAITLVTFQIRIPPDADRVRKEKTSSVTPDTRVKR